MLRATFSTSARTCCIASELPAMRASAPGGAAGAGGGTTPDSTTRGAGFAARDALCDDGSWSGCTVGPVAAPRPSAEATTLRNSFRSTGLVR